MLLTFYLSVCPSIGMSDTMERENLFSKSLGPRSLAPPKVSVTRWEYNVDTLFLWNCMVCVYSLWKVVEGWGNSTNKFLKRYVYLSSIHLSWSFHNIINRLISGDRPVTWSLFQVGQLMVKSQISCSICKKKSFDLPAKKQIVGSREETCPYLPPPPTPLTLRVY